MEEKTTCAGQENKRAPRACWGVGGGYTGPFREFNGVNEEDIFHTAHQVDGGEYRGKNLTSMHNLLHTVHLKEYKDVTTNSRDRI